jgi:ubiquinone/menaquinone biosynthesis C-methylase UbiE
MSDDIKSSKKSNQYFWKENFETFQNEEAVRYHQGVTENPFSTKLYDALMDKLLAPILSSSKCLNILDAGGGTGKWAVYFAKKGHKVTLCDVAEPMLDIARSVVVQEGLQDKVTVEQGNIVELSYKDESFDFVFSDRNPISHCGKKEDSYKSINELYRVLKPGGKIIGCVLNRMRKVAQMTMELDLSRALSLIEEGDIRRGENEYTHYYLLDELKTVLLDTGFIDTSVYGTTVFTELIPTAWVLDEIPLKQLLELEIKAREYSEIQSYGVRFHFVSNKPI